MVSKPWAVPILFQDREQLVLAMKAAHGVVAGVVGIFQLAGFDDFDRDPVFTGESERVFEVSTSEAGGIGNDGEHAAGERLVRRPCQESGVHTSE